MPAPTLMAKRAAAGTLALAVCFSGGALALAGAAHAATGFAFGAPIAGATRLDTAVAAADAGFPHGASSVVVVNAQSTVDGLTAAYIAGLHNAPILYTNATSTPAQTTAEMGKLGAKSVYVVGGTSVVSQSQLDTWKSAGMGVTSYGGSNRYSTAAAAADAGGGQGTAFVASGDDAHLADALSIGAIAYQKHYPILLTQVDGVPAETKAELTKLGATPIVVGGNTGVSDSTMASLGSSTRLGGANRSQTAAVVAGWAIGHAGFTKTSVALVGADNANAADALVAAPIAGMNGVPMLFAGTADTNAYLASNASNYTGQGFVFGGSSAVSSSAITSATSAATMGTLPVPVLNPTSILTSFADAGTAGTIDANDVIRIKFTTPLVTPAVGASIRLTDGDGTIADLVNGTNATFAVNSSAISDGTAFNGSAAGTVLTVTLTGAPSTTALGTATGGTGGLQALATITGASGIKGTAGGTWNVAASLAGTAPVSAVQTLTVPTAATGGSFTITGSTNAPQTVNVSGLNTSSIQTAVAVAYGLSSGLVSVTGPTAGVYTITFAGSVGPKPTLTTTSTLTSPAPTASSAVTTAGVAAVSAVQTITFSSTNTLTSGSLSLTGSSSTGTVTYTDLNTPTTSAISTAAATATGVTPTSVTGTLSAGFIVTFPASAGPVPLMTTTGSNLSNGSAVTPTVAPTALGVSAVASVQTVTVPSAATGGTFTITGSSSTSSSIGYLATATQVEGAVETAYGLGGSTVSVSGPVSRVYTITFPAGASSSISTTSSLTGTAVTTSAASSTTGILGVSGTVIG